MRIDATKIDQRIQKLQEIKRIAADPELVEMLFEFMDIDEEMPSSSSALRRSAKPETGRAALAPDEASEVVNRVVRSVSG